MSDAPETIWVNINDSEDGCCPVEDEHFGDGRFYDPDTATEYRRADLPPALSAAMQLPEVVALVEAGSWLAVCAQTTGGTAGRDDDLVNAIAGWVATIRAIKEPKP